MEPGCSRWCQPIEHEKLMNRKFYLNVKKNVFTVQVIKHWSRLPREVVNIFNNCLDTILCHVL